MSNRAETLKRIMDESQRHYAAYVLFNQAMADHLGMHPTDLQCVALLDLESGPVSTGEIARLTGLTPGSATRLVDRLEKAGCRTASRSDGPQAGAGRPRTRPQPGSVKPGRRRERRSARCWSTYTDAELDVIADYLRRRRRGPRPGGTPQRGA